MRHELPHRRPCLSMHLTHVLGNGQRLKIHATFGFERYGSRVIEIFCDDFKAGSDQQAEVSQHCIDVSKLLQYGETARTLADSMGETGSIIRTLVRRAAMIDAEAGY